MALNDAQINPEAIGYVNAHGTSTKLNDKYESIAIKNTLGDHAYKVDISSTKSMTGHLLGAAGAIEMIAGLDGMANNYIPPTINFSSGDEDCDLNYTPNTPKETTFDTFMSNSFGFGIGYNAVLIANVLTAKPNKHKRIAGVDEAGRGALAGPVVACCATLKPSFCFYEEINDSKKLSERKRNHLFDAMRQHIHLGIGLTTHRFISRKNVLKATLVAMEQAVRKHTSPLIMSSLMEIKRQN